MKKRKMSIALLLIFVMVFSFSGCTFDIVGPNTQPTMVPKGTVTPIPTLAKDPTKAPTKKPTSTPAPTEEVLPSATPTPEPTSTPTVTPSPTPTATNTPTPTPIPYSVNVCRTTLANKIGSGYTISGGTAIVVSGGRYFKFTVSDNETTYTPDIIVNVYDLSIYYYYSSGEILTLETFPLDNGEKKQEIDPNKLLTEAEARAILGGIPLSTLGLSADLSTYSVSFDAEALVMYKGVEYYDVSVIDSKDRRKGEYLISLDKSTVYRSGDFGDWELIK